MSQKKHKKRHPQAKRRVSAPVEESEFASDGTRKRMPGSNMKNCIILYISSASDRDLFRIAPDRRMIPYS